MKLFNFHAGEEIHLGVQTDAGARDLTAGGFPLDMDALLRAGQAGLDAAAAAAASAPAAPENPRYAKVCTPGKLLCVGLNYRAHARETGQEEPREPVLFSKFNNALAACGEAVSLPPWLYHYDHEAELVIVIGATAWNASPEEARAAIFGYTCGNDLSERKAQSASAQWLIGKSLPGFAPAGPCVVTADSFNPAESHAITCAVNGVTAQSSDVTDMIFSCPEIVSYASRFIRLEPGDLIFTGTPSGVIMGRKREDRTWLKPGDRVEVSIQGIGTLVNDLV